MGIRLFGREHLVDRRAVGQLLESLVSVYRDDGSVGNAGVGGSVFVFHRDRLPIDRHRLRVVFVRRAAGVLAPRHALDRVRRRVGVRRRPHRHTERESPERHADDRHRHVHVPRVSRGFEIHTGSGSRSYLNSKCERERDKAASATGIPGRTAMRFGSIELRLLVNSDSPGRRRSGPPSARRWPSTRPAFGRRGSRTGSGPSRSGVRRTAASR